MLAHGIRPSHQETAGASASSSVHVLMRRNQRYGLGDARRALVATFAAPTGGREFVSALGTVVVPLGIVAVAAIVATAYLFLQAV